MSLTSKLINHDGTGAGFGGNSKSDLRVRGADGYYRETPSSDAPRMRLKQIGNQRRELNEQKAKLESSLHQCERPTAKPEVREQIEPLKQTIRCVDDALARLESQEKEIYQGMISSDDGRESLRL